MKPVVTNALVPPGPRAKFGPIQYGEMPAPKGGMVYAPTPGWVFQGALTCRKLRSKERGLAVLGVFARCCKDCRRPFTVRCSLFALQTLPPADADRPLPGPLTLRRCRRCIKARNNPAAASAADTKRQARLTGERAATAREKTRLRVAKYRAIRDLIG